MEREFYNNEFEDLIKESADDFKMYPSKKVWQGLYNNLHPGRRWPSLGVTLALIFGLITISYLNTQQFSQSRIVDQNVSPVQSTASNNVTSVAAPDILVSSADEQSVNANSFLQKKTITISGNTTAKATIKKVSYYDYQNIESPALEQVSISVLKEAHNKVSQENSIPALSTVESNQHKNAELLLSKAPSEYAITYINNSPALAGINSLSNSISVSERTGNTNVTILQNFIPQEITASKTAKAVKKLKTSKVRWMYSLSPTVSYRRYTATEAHDANVVLAGLFNVLPGYDLNRKFSHHPSAGLEAGLTMKYPLNKYLKFTTGLQLNYSSYIIEANTVHPMMATLLMQNKNTGAPIAYSSISFYGNGPGVAPVNLRNYAVNVSIPVGLEYQLGGNDKVKYYIAATAQPVLALMNRSYILSTDNKNYLTNSSMARQWNMATNVGAFMSVNSKKLNWQLGPQVNYQLLSSYTDAYPVKEHYINYGIKLAVGKKL
jgi:hypothetical protein